MSPVEWLLINWHWAWILFIIFVVLVFGVLVFDEEWFD